VSYSLYLWHWLVLSELQSHRLGPGSGLGPARLPVAAAELAAITIPIAAASYLLIERPAMRWSHRLRPAAPATAPVPLAAAISETP